MGQLFRYALESGFILCLGYMVYKWVMAGERQHAFNRAALYAIYLLSFLLPLLHLPVSGHFGHHAGGGIITSELQPLGIVSDGEDWTRLLPLVLVAVYLAGALVTLAATLTGLYRIMTIIRGGEKISTGRFTLVITDNGTVAPFSFFRYYVISREDWKSAADAITVHEQRHLQLYHWVDLLLVQFTCIFQWFNPAAWLLGEEFKTVHEYQADEAVIASGADIRQYQLLLIKKAVGTRFQALANSLNHSKLKKRVTMMYKSKSSAARRLAALLLVPTMGLGIFLVKSPAVASTLESGSDLSFLSESIGEVSEISSNGNASALSIAPTSSSAAEEKVYEAPQKLAEFPGGLPELMMFIAKRLKYPEAAVKENVQGKVVVSFVVGKDGVARDFKIVKGVDPRLDAEALRVMKEMPKWTPGENDGQKVASSFTLPVQFRLKPDKKEQKTDK